MKIFRIICFISVCLLACLCFSSAEKKGISVDWQKIRSAYGDFLKKPSSHHARALVNTLPERAVAPEELVGAGEETVAYIFDGERFKHFEDIVRKAKPEHMRAALKMTNIADEDHSGELEALLGSCITANPAGFLDTVKDASEFRLRGILGNFSGEFDIDNNARIKELNENYAAIEKIRKRKYLQIRDKCLAIIKIFIEERESMKIQGE
ncbi:MAG: hypothetical protein ABII64_05920 [Elusimicrobiota bacterium]